MAALSLAEEIPFSSVTVFGSLSRICINMLHSLSLIIAHFQLVELAMSAKRWRRAGEMTEEEKLVASRQVPPGIGTSTFLLAKVPEEVRAAVPKLHTMETAVVRALLQVCMRYAQAGSLSQSDFERVVAKVGIEREDCEVVVGGLLTLLQAAVRSRQQSSAIEKGLTAMNVPKDIVTDLVKLVSLRRVELEHAALDHRIRCPTLTSLQWRVDVTLSTGAVSRVMQPCIVLRLSLSDGKLQTVELSMDAFDKLRYSVATVLKQMRRVETHPIMNVVEADIERDRSKSVSRPGK